MSSKLKPLLITLEYPPFKGGVALYYYNLHKFWPDNNLEVLSLRQKLNPWQYFYYLGQIKKQKFNHLIVGQILPLGTVALFYKIFRKKSYSLILHGLDLSLALRHKKRLTRLILKSAKHIICANYFTAGLISEFKDKIQVVNPGLDIEEVEKNLNLAPDIDYHKIILISIGRLVKRKGIDKTIEALKSLDKMQSQKIDYLIIGTGPDEKYLKDLAGHCQFIKFLGEVAELEKWQYLKNCDIFIMPTRNIAGDFEGFGTVYLEANLAKKPIIAGKAGGVGDAVINNLNGLMVDGENTSEILEALMKLIDNPELRWKLGAEGYARVKMDFNWQSQAQKIFKILNS